MASPIETKPSTTSKTGFLNLPREIRDEIYRLLVKGDYIAAGQPPSGQSKSNDYRTTATTSLKLAIFRVSKPLNEEAMDIFYPESTFNFNMYQGSIQGRGTTALFASREAIYRMMNIDINIDVDDLEVYLDGTGLDSLFALYEERLRIWKSLMRSITCAESRRNTIRIRCRSCSSDITTKMPRWMYASLGRLRQFRAVVVALSPPLIVETNDKGTSHGTDQSAEHLETLESEMGAIKDCLQRTLGPAVTGHKHHPGHQQYATTLEFHPQEYLSKIASAETTDWELERVGFKLKVETMETGM